MNRETIAEEFAHFMQCANPKIERGSNQWNDLEGAFFAGAFIAFNHFLAATKEPDELVGIAQLEAFKKELLEHAKLWTTRADMARDIEESGR